MLTTTIRERARRGVASGRHGAHAEPEPRPWTPLRKTCEGRDEYGVFEEWVNDLVEVVKRPHVLMIANRDGSARHDWREFQRVKSQLMGDEAEMVELYPAESRLQDPSNAFFLWKLPRGVLGRMGIRLPRNVLSSDDAIAPQRDPS